MKGPTPSGPVGAPICQAFCPSVLYVKGLDAITYVVLECWVANRHAPLTPLQSSFIDGFHRVDGPAGQVSVELGLGPLWDMALWKFGFVVRQQTCSVGHLHTDGNLAMFL